MGLPLKWDYHQPPGPSLGLQRREPNLDVPFEGSWGWCKAAPCLWSGGLRPLLRAALQAPSSDVDHYAGALSHLGTDGKTDRSSAQVFRAKPQAVSARSRISKGRGRPG